MKVRERPSLAGLNTFGVTARAGLLLEIENEEDVLQIPRLDPSRDLVLGGGSNVLFVGDVPGTVLLNRIGGISILEENAEQALVEVGAGESWHGLVSWSVGAGLSGLENLALIPGLTGAAPIQNIGAYGVELSSVLDSVTAWDTQRANWSVLNGAQCGFSYRDSVFKSAHPGRYFITSICIRLSKQFIPRLQYAGLVESLHQAGVSQPGPRDVYDAVVALRRRKLPDPAVQGNAGSFFKNPVLSRQQFETLLSRFPALPSWILAEDSVKISAAWMIEQCKLKGHRINGAEVSTLHALVLVNRGQARGADVWKLAQHVQNAVHDRFGITLEPKPLIYGQAPN